MRTGCVGEGGRGRTRSNVSDAGSVIDLGSHLLHNLLDMLVGLWSAARHQGRACKAAGLIKLTDGACHVVARHAARVSEKSCHLV